MKVNRKNEVTLKFSESEATQLFLEMKEFNIDNLDSPIMHELYQKLHGAIEDDE
jgi:hypothetical protein